jgi:hypothetical protein
MFDTCTSLKNIPLLDLRKVDVIHNDKAKLRIILPKLIDLKIKILEKSEMAETAV